MDFVPGFARRLGHPGHLFFEPPVGRGAACLGGLFCPRLNLAPVAVATAAGIRGFHRIVCWRGCVVDIDYAIAPSTLAAGSRGHAARKYRRRPRAYHRGPEFRLPQPE